MMVSDFDYNLPEELIAQSPVSPRDHSRLLVLHQKTNRLEHRRFFNIVDYLNKGDVLIINDSKVIPARLRGKKVSGGVVEVFLSKPMVGKFQDRKKEIWECLIKDKRIGEGTDIIFSSNFKATVEEKINDVWLVSFNITGEKFRKALERYGQTPLPPYIQSRSSNTKKQYQTVYADDSKNGSVAAPTAGLHFTPKLLQQLKKKGVVIKTITLHVGLGTFLPIRVNNPKKHQMHAELVAVSKEVKQEIRAAQKRKNKVIAVGTTTARSLEAAFKDSKARNFYQTDFNNWVDIFIYPPYKFKAIDGLITNFHLPKSTLLMLVSALTRRKKILQAYEEAIREKYRFFSFGDAMMIIE